MSSANNSVRPTPCEDKDGESVFPNYCREPASCAAGSRIAFNFFLASSVALLESSCEFAGDIVPDAEIGDIHPIRVTFVSARPRTRIVPSTGEPGTGRIYARRWSSYVQCTEPSATVFRTPDVGE